VGTTPCRCAKHDLDFLATRESPHGVVGNKLRLKTKVSKVALNLPTNERTEKADTLSFTSVNVNHFLSTKKTIRKRQ
jgi:hypothetical protein